MKIEIMNESHKDKVLELSKAFYCSDALDHEVPMNIIETNIDAAISGDKGLIGLAFSFTYKSIICTHIPPTSVS